MPYEQRNNSGSMFKNDDKFAPGTNAVKDGANPDWPDRQGKAMVGGVMYYVSGWLKTSKEGKPWLSLSFKLVNPSQQQRAPVGQRYEGTPPSEDEADSFAPTPDNLDPTGDEIPFS